MTVRHTPPFRADHVGSLLRPQRLLDARARAKAGELDADELRGVEDDAIREVVRMQEDLGLRSATDGEFRRTSWHMDFIYSLGGVAATDEKLKVHFRNADGELDFESAALRVHDRISDVRWKHVLLPLWMSSYRFKDKVYRFMINGQTGQVQGERPMSFWKIFFFVSGLIIVLLILAKMFAK